MFSRHTSSYIETDASSALCRKRININDFRIIPTFLYYIIGTRFLHTKIALDRSFFSNINERWRYPDRPNLSDRPWVASIEFPWSIRAYIQRLKYHEQHLPFDGHTFSCGIRARHFCHGTTVELQQKVRRICFSFLVFILIRRQDGNLEDRMWR